MHARVYFCLKSHHIACLPFAISIILCWSYQKHEMHYMFMMKSILSAISLLFSEKELHNFTQNEIFLLLRNIMCEFKRCY